MGVHRRKFIVVIENKDGTQEAVGPYLTLKTAMADAMSWDINDQKAWVLIISAPYKYKVRLMKKRMAKHDTGVQRSP
jgi:hypothetical protein